MTSKVTGLRIDRFTCQKLRHRLCGKFPDVNLSDCLLFELCEYKNLVSQLLAEIIRQRSRCSMSGISPQLLEDRELRSKVRDLVSDQLQKTRVTCTRKVTGFRFDGVESDPQNTGVEIGRPVPHPNGFQFLMYVTAPCRMRLTPNQYEGRQSVVSAKCSGFLTMTIHEAARQKELESLRTSDLRLTLELTSGTPTD